VKRRAPTTSAQSKSAPSFDLARLNEQIRHLLAAYRGEGATEGLKAGTLALREYTIRTWLDWLEKHTRLRPLELLSSEDVTMFIVAERERGIAPSTIGVRWAHLHAFCAWLVKEEVIDRSPMLTLRQPKVGKKLTPVLTADEFRAFIGTCAGKDFISRRDRALIYFLLDTGLRLSELLSMRLASVDLERRRVKIVGKGGDERLVTYGDNVARVLRLYLYSRALHPQAEHPALWISQRGQLAATTVEGIIAKRGKAVGLDMWPHRLRHQWAHMMLESGAQERDVMRLGGWNSTAMLGIYGEAAATERALDAHKRHSPGDKF
jgi:site-specific recombinase XerC